MAGREIWLGRALALAALVATFGCGGAGGGGGAGDSNNDADTTVAAEREAARPAQDNAVSEQATAEQSGAMVLSADDLDSYRQGKQAEIADVKKKAAGLAAAKSEMDSLNALGLLADEAGRTQAGAEAAGMSVAQYQRLTSAVNDVLGAYSVSEMMRKSQAGVDTAKMPADARAQIRANIAEARAGLEKLPAENVKLIVPHAAELDSLRLLPAALAMKAASGG